MRTKIEDMKKACSNTSECWNCPYDYLCQLTGFRGLKEIPVDDLLETLNEYKDIPLDETFCLNGKKFIVRQAVDECSGCYFDNSPECKKVEKYYCQDSERKDNTDVIFVKTS